MTGEKYIDAKKDGSKNGEGKAGVKSFFLRPHLEYWNISKDYRSLLFLVKYQNIS